MPKTKLKVRIDNTEYIVNYSIDKEIISYKELDNTLVNYDLDKNILIRDNDEIHMIYDFNNKTGSILIKEMDRELEILIENIDIERDKNNIKVNYSIENNDFMYELEVL